MSTDDSDRSLTRRQALQGAGGAAASTAVFPLKHNPDDDSEGLFSGLFGGDADIIVTDADGNVIVEDPDEFRFDGSAVKAIEEVGHPDSTIVRVTLQGGSDAGGGAFKDTDGDGVAELQEDHADFQSGDARNISKATVDEFENDTDILVIGPSGGLIHRVDPSTTTTPVQDALAEISASSAGTIHLPTGNTQDPGPVDLRDFATIKGHGWGGDDASILEITGGGAGLRVPSESQVRFGNLLDFRLKNGSGLGNGGIGMYLNGTLRQFDVRLRFDDWERPFVCDSASYENRFQRMHFQNCDAGNQNGLMDIQTSGPVNTIGMVTSYPTASHSSADSTTLYFDGSGADTEWKVTDGMNLGGSSGTIVWKQSLANLIVEAPINWEPTDQQSTPDRLIFDANDETTRFAGIRINNATADNVYFCNGGDSRLGRVTVDGDATLNGSIVYVNTDIGESIVYEGPVENSETWTEVDNQSGSQLSNPVVTLHDVTKKVSTGAGYDGGTNDSQL